MSDWNQPTVSRLYTDYTDDLKGRDVDLAKGLDPAVVTVTNPQTNFIRWNSASGLWEKYNGSTWPALASIYNINVDKHDGFDAGNASGNVPVSNGTVNTNLNADMVDGSHAGTGANNVLKLDGSGLVPQANIPTGIPWSKITSTPTTIAGYGITNALTTAGGTMTSGDLTLFQDPTSALHAVTKQYVDGLANGLDVKGSTKAATTVNITLSGSQTIDGVSCNPGDRVLVKNQSTTSQNGIYVVSAGAWTRALDADSWNEHIGAFCFVEQGTVNADSAWVCTVNAGGTLGSTAVTFSQFAGPGTVTAGAGIAVSGYQVSLGTGNALALHNLASNGLVARTGAGTVAARTLTAPAAGITVSNGNGVSGDPTLVLANDLAALEALGSAGFAVRTTTDTWTQRTLTGTANRISITNGDGVSGNPTIDIGSDVVTPSSTHTLANKTFTNPAGTAQTLSFVSSPSEIAWNANNGAVAKVTLAGTGIIGAPSNLKAGGRYTLYVVQDATGSRDATWNSIYKFPLGLKPVLSTAANAVDVFDFISFDGATLEGGQLKGVATGV
jgi:hypothetical protein